MDMTERNCLIKTALTLALVVAGVQSVMAETVSKKETERIARMFFNEANHRVMAEPKLVYTGRKLTTDRLFNPFYVYNLPAGGFVIVSAENKAFPILGYSLKSSFNPDDLDRDEKALLRNYALDIEHIRYDSSVPYEAIKAWNDIPKYISGLLGERFAVTDPVCTSDDAREIVSNIFTTGRADELSSDIFTPAQWQEMIDDELSHRGNVVLGIIDSQYLGSGLLHGRKGDYYRIAFERPNDWLMRLHATEIISDGQVAELGDIPMADDSTIEEDPFEFHDSFVAEIRAGIERLDRDYELKIYPDEPQLRSLGGGHFQIWFPENIRLLRLYNLNGSMVMRQTYGETDTASVDMSSLPAGFYFVTVECDNDGHSYGFKLWR